MSHAQYAVDAAQKVVDSKEHTNTEKAIVLLEVAMGLLQQHGESVLVQVIALLEQAHALESIDQEVSAELALQMASTRFQFTAQSAESLQQLISLLTPPLQSATTETRAEAYMLRGLLHQTLALNYPADYQLAVNDYDEAITYFSADRYPVEHSLIQNNLATLWLALKDAGIPGQAFDLLAVNAFEAALACLDPERHPVEFAMLANNLGNALQQANESEALANHYRALDAYDQALKIRRQQDNRAALATTLANRAQCLQNLASVGTSYRESTQNAKEALALFTELGDTERANLMRDLLNSQLPEKSHAFAAT